MISRNIALDQIVPWLFSGASGCYILARVRKLSLAKASRAPWPRFLARHSDVILILCGSPAVWHLARRWRTAQRYVSYPKRARTMVLASVNHQLRQVFTVLLIGLGLIVRKAGDGKSAELISLARRLQEIIRDSTR